MPVTVTINSVDRSRNIQWRSLKIDNVLTNKTDTASFDVLYESEENTFKPTIGHIVNIKDGATTIFEGPIVRVDEYPTNYKSVLYRVTCTDYGRFLDRKLVVDTYEQQSIGATVADIISSYAPDFTTNNVNATFTADFVAFNYETVSDCFRQLCDIGGLDWYVDNDKDIHMFSKEQNTAPLALTDTSGNWDYNSLVLRQDNSQVVNQIYVRGGEYLGTEFTATIEANGVDYIYPVGYRYQDFDVTLTGNPLTVGVDYLDDPDDYDVLYNFQEKIIRWKSADKPSNASEIRVSGKPYLPVIVKISDREAQAAMATAEGGDGIYEKVIIDKSIDTKQGGRERADADLERYKETIVEGSFTSHTSGLRAGQLLHVNVASRAVNDWYIINKVKYSMRTPTSMRYDISLISKKTYGILEWMQRQLRDESKKIEINADEVLDVIEAADAEVNIGETVTEATVRAETETMETPDTFTSYIDSPPTWVAGYYGPSGLSDRKRPPFTDRDCNLGS